MKRRSPIDFLRPVRAARLCRLIRFGLGAALLNACSSNAPLVTAPVMVPLPTPASYVETTPTGGIFQAHMTAETLFTTERRPRAIGDLLKVDIKVSTKASSSSSTDATRTSALAVKGPGTAASDAVLAPIWNIDANANGRSDFNGKGSADSQNSFEGQLTVSVINVLPNGYLLVAGERALGVHGNNNHLRFSGVVNPRDIRRGNVVSSADVANAAIEYANAGAIGDATSRSWLQRVLSRTLSIW